MSDTSDVCLNLEDAFDQSRSDDSQSQSHHVNISRRPKASETNHIPDHHAATQDAQYNKSPDLDGATTP